MGDGGVLVVVVEKVVEAERRVLVGVGHVVQGGGVDAVAGAYLEDVAFGIGDVKGA